jgi:hypothetical protein
VACEFILEIDLPGFLVTRPAYCNSAGIRAVLEHMSSDVLYYDTPTTILPSTTQRSFTLKLHFGATPKTELS